MTFSERIERRNENQQEYLNRFGHHYSTYGYFLLNSEKDDEILQQCIDENKPVTEILDEETLEVIKKAAQGEFG